ncbi:MAG: hypothetical protein ACPGTQ_04105 [Colwellia sp.]
MNKLLKTSNYTLISALLLSILSGCGGSGSSLPDTDSQSPNSSIIQLDDEVMIQQLDDEVMIQQSVDLFLLDTENELTDIQWQQTAGSGVTVLAKSSKVISFTPTSAGDYSFSVSYKANNGATQTATHSVEVINQTSEVTARLSHEARTGNKVSLRASFADSVDLSTISWVKTQGPEVTLTDDNTDGKKAIYFDAPDVNVDTLVTFEVSATSNGTTYSDKVAVLVEPAAAIDTENVYFEDRLAKVFPYSSSSPYAEDLVNCVYSNELNSSCRFSTLPLIAQEDSVIAAVTPSVDDIMDRVVVSHEWMGKRFKDFLTNQDPHNDFKNLLRATTAIVISYDVRPSFYWAVTGAIYLDPNNFWLTPQERDTINQAPDYRASFGNELQFKMPWRYVKNNNYASEYIGIDERISRSADSALYRLASLMYHELAHANDFLPSTQWLIHSDSRTVLEAACNWDGNNCLNTKSLELSQRYPLTSDEMYRLGEVSFKGANANATQKSYLPNDVAAFFSPDTANDYYAYSSIREDYAMLFEEVMMKARYGLDRDVAVTNQPTGDIVYANDYIVEWGQRGRIGEASIKPRVQFSAENVLPEFDSVTAVSSLPLPIPMVMGNDWIENLYISPSLRSLSIKSNDVDNESNNLLNRPVNTFRYIEKTLPKHIH